MVRIQAIVNFDLSILLQLQAEPSRLAKSIEKVAICTGPAKGRPDEFSHTYSQPNITLGLP